MPYTTTCLLMYHTTCVCVCRIYRLYAQQSHIDTYGFLLLTRHTAKYWIVFMCAISFIFLSLNLPLSHLLAHFVVCHRFSSMLNAEKRLCACMSICMRYVSEWFCASTLRLGMQCAYTGFYRNVRHSRRIYKQDKKNQTNTRLTLYVCARLYTNLSIHPTVWYGIASLCEYFALVSHAANDVFRFNSFICKRIIQKKKL